MKKNKYFLLLLCSLFMLPSCGGKSETISSEEISSSSFLSSSESLSSENTISYKVNVYLENLSGNYELASGYSYEREGVLGEVCKIEPIEYEGFSLVKSKSSTQKYLNEGTEFNLYYKRNEYSIFVSFGSSSKEKAKFGETVTLTFLDPDGTYFLDSEAKGKLKGDKLTMGSEDVFVFYRDENEIKFDSNILLANNDFSFDSEFNLDDVTNKIGVIFLHNIAEASPTLEESYYYYGIDNGNLVFSSFQNNKENVIKSVKLNGLNKGMHTLKVEADKNSTFTFSFDGEVKLTCKSKDISDLSLTPLSNFGRVATYSKNKVFGFTSFNVTKGSKNINEAKNFYSSIATSMLIPSFSFNTSTYACSEGNTYVSLLTFKSVKDIATSYSKKVYSCKTLDEINEAIKGSLEYKALAVKDYAETNIYKLLHDIHYVFFMAFVEVEEVTIPETNVTLTRDYNEEDKRWWVPNAYKLRGEGEEVGVLDLFEEELSKASTTAEYTELIDRFTIDAIKALVFRDVEFIYYQEEADKNQEVYPQYGSFLYNMCGEKGSGFTYTGKAFKNYTWDKDYRLNKYFFGTPSVGGVTGLYDIVSGFDWILKAQTIKNRPYSITLNTMGGLVDNNIVAGNSENETSLPTPTREGYTFDGWYPSRLFRGNPVSKVPAGNLKDLTYYAKWKKDGKEVNASILPNNFFTENMILQANKPIKVFGSGEEGKQVSVTLGTESLQTTVSNGHWEVTFPAKEASFNSMDLTISSTDIFYTFKNVIVGEVWLASGQSNMEFLPSWLIAKGADLIGEYGKYTNYENIRLYRQYVDDIEDAGNDLGDCWCTANRVNEIYDKSSVGTIFALKLQQLINKPVGVIISARGGTYIEEWLSEESITNTFNTIPSADQAITSRYYNYMTKELIGINVAGVIWYQGENNCANPNEYREQYKALVGQWRSIFNDSSLPVICQQLVQYGYLDFSEIRIAQWESMKDLDNAYCSCAIDTGEEFDIHPADKITLGERLAAIAGEYVYSIGSNTLSYNPISANKIGNTITINFDSSVRFEDKDGNSLEGSEVSYLQVKDSSGNFTAVTGVIEGNTIVINTLVDAVAVCYAYKPFIGEINLFGNNHLPINTFFINLDK